MKRGSSAAKQSGWNGNRPGVIALGQRIKYFPIGRCSSTGKSAVTGCGGSKVFKTLKATCFLVRQHGGEWCWNRLGNQNPVPISPFGNGGKIRPIDAPHITDRQIHKTLCNEVLIPLYSPSMIYDNGASQKGKGLHWQFKRIKQQLGWHYRRYGREGAVLLLDLKGFFPNASHALLYQRHRELILNPELQNLADTVIRYSPCPTPGRGMPLGVEPSQQEMVALPSKIDQWIKCQARVHCAGHYMDDYYAFFPTVDEAKLMGHEIVRRFEAAGIKVNKRKCKVIPLTKPFRFCKARFTLTETGKIKVNGSRDGVKRARRKLKLFHKEFKEGKRSFFDIEQYMECQSAYYRNFNDHGRLLRLRRLYHAIFFGGGQCLESSKPGPVSA